MGVVPGDGLTVSIEVVFIAIMIPVTHPAAFSFYDLFHKSQGGPGRHKEFDMLFVEGIHIPGAVKTTVSDQLYPGIAKYIQIPDEYL